MNFLWKSQNLHKTISSFVLFVILFFSVLIESSHLFAQTETEIKNPNKFLWGAEATGEDLEKVRDYAKKYLANHIVETIHATTSRDYMELNDDVIDYKRIQINSVSRLTLKSVRFLEKKSGDKFKVIAFISKPDYKKSLELVAIEIRQTVKIAESKELETDLAIAIKDYYFAYLKTFHSPEPIFYESIQTDEEFENIRPFLRSKIESFLSTCEVVSLEPKIDPRIPDQIVLPFRVSYMSQSVSDLTLQLNMPNEHEYVVKNGAANIYIDFKPTFRVKQFSLILALNYDEKLNPDNIILELQKSYKIVNEKTLNTDFSSVIKIDFKVTVKNGLLSFKHIIENLSLFDWEWDFGDGTISKEDSPSHVYKDQKDYIVTLTLNQDNNMSISKNVSFNGNSTEEQDTNANNDILDTLLKTKSFEVLEKQLINYKNNKKLNYGAKKSDFIDPENCYVFIISASSKRLIAVLDKDKSGRKDLLSGEMVYNIVQKYNGEGAIWVRIY